jgi:hypothetical protein
MVRQILKFLRQQNVGLLLTGVSLGSDIIARKYKGPFTLAPFAVIIGAILFF